MTPAVSPSLRALLAGSVDYAGLFPPANLTLESALVNYSAYVRGNDRWMLGRFVLPTAKMQEAGRFLAAQFDPIRSLRISALGPKPNLNGVYVEQLRTSLQEMVSFASAYGDKFVTDCYYFEAQLPPDISSGPALHTFLQQSYSLIETLVPWPLRAFWEVPFSQDLSATIHRIAEFNKELRTSTILKPFGIKLRTGGTEAIAFPAPDQLADALIVARDAGVHLKFTAGLHHPFRHFDEAMRTRMHGFVNVFAAGVLAREHRLDAAETQTILEDECAENFRFEAERFAWRNRSIETAALAAHRLFVTSFGSCSFDEPRDDLRHFGLLA